MTHLHLAVALDGTGWHPASWREPGARPGDVFTAGYWTDLVREAERAALDLVTLEDGLGPQSSVPLAFDHRTDQVRGRLDAVLIAARVAPTTTRIGIVPTTSTTHTEPFHVGIGIASLDFVSRGRAGWRPQISPRAAEAAHFGRRVLPELAPADFGTPEAEAFVAGLLTEAGDHVEVVRRLWDSWEDDAEIRDAATGRFLDRDKLHYIDFEGEFFSVRGPSITPRPPQGQPLVTALAHSAPIYRFAARGADVVFVTPHGRDEAASITAEVRAAEAETGRTGAPLTVLGDLVVFLDDEPGAAAARLARLDRVDPLASDAEIFAGTPAELADLLLDWSAAGLAGFRLRPGVLPHDLTAIADGLVPELRRRGAFRDAYAEDTLRARFGLPRPANRYAAAP
ncbi:LLM class flavin-dependent oxidoreductase [Actinomadura rayongensis]|uniref:LLM class flavin-dependent oxidoreductase n=1 Tax=Actinomadura rayongensis TaxID=1429076 RepID=A0A6I4WDF9_9ACTN|nr:LLM class flavin-dependent oxidoreductase [Actinomadura rayongensis]